MCVLIPISDERVKGLKLRCGEILASPRGRKKILGLYWLPKGSFLKHSFSIHFLSFILEFFLDSFKIPSTFILDSF